MCHREAYWEKTASSEFEAEPNGRDEATERGWWGVRAADRGRGLVEDDSPESEREEDAIPADD